MSRLPILGNIAHAYNGKDTTGVPYQNNELNSRTEITVVLRDDTDENAAHQSLMKFAQEHKFTVVGNNLKHSRKFSAKLRHLKKAFEIDFHKNEGYRIHQGNPTLPDYLHPHVIAVLGLSNHPIATNHIRRPRVTSGYTPLQLADLYNFPPNTDGTGQGIAIIELGGGYTSSDLTTYFTNLKIPTPIVNAISVDGGRNVPGVDTGADGEVTLDIEVAGAVAPGSHINVYFTSNTDKGFYDAIAAAIHDQIHTNSVISISWGQMESTWSQATINAFEQAFAQAHVSKITVCAAAGDNGSSDGNNDGNDHVDYPASSPFVLACGGTSLIASENTITSETVWNSDGQSGATGGGVSTVFSVPVYQSNNGVIPLGAQTSLPGRGVPDVAGDADPNTGYIILLNGQQSLIGEHLQFHR